MVRNIHNLSHRMLSIDSLFYFQLDARTLDDEMKGKLNTIDEHLRKGLYAMVFLFFQFLLNAYNIIYLSETNFRVVLFSRMNF